MPDLSTNPRGDGRAGPRFYSSTIRTIPRRPWPTGLFLKRWSDFARENQIIVCHDAAYSEIAYDGYRPMSFLEVPGAKEVGIEFHSLSKTYNMTGWRIGFAVGNAQLIAGLSQVKSNIDSGAAQAIQWAGIEALEGPQDGLSKLNAVYQRRRDLMVAGLKKIGLEVEPPKATFYLWIEVPERIYFHPNHPSPFGEDRDCHHSGKRLWGTGGRLFSDFVDRPGRAPGRGGGAPE